MTSEKEMTAEELRHNGYLERLERLRPIDDIFMRGMFRDNLPLGEFVLRIILNKEDLKLSKFEVQKDFKHVTGARSVVFDAYGEDTQGTVHAMEVQKAADGADPYRARYYSSTVDIGKLKAKQDFSELPEKWVIFITEKDFFKDGAPYHHIRNMDVDTGKVFEDGTHILYVNGEYRGDDPLGKLMHDFTCANPDDMYYNIVKERAKYLKKAEKGVSTMCEEMEKLRAEGKAEGITEGKKEMAMNLLKDGELPVEKIAAAAGLSVDEIEDIKKNI